MTHEPAKSTRSIEALIADALHHDGVFTAQEAADQGVHASALTRALKSGRIRRILPGVYMVTGVRDTWWATARAGVGWCDGALSHLSAAFALGLIERPPDRIDLVTRSHRKPPAGSTFRCHTSPLLSPPHVVKVRDMPVTAPARTLLDIAAEVSEEHLEVVLEEGLRRGLVTMARMEWQLKTEGSRGRRGTSRLRALLRQRDPRLAPAESVLETKVARWFRSTRLPEPVRQHRVISDGRVVGRIDFAYPTSKVAIEVQSYRWHSGRREWVKDQRKVRQLRDLGWQVICVVAEDFDESPAELEAEIASRLGIRLF